jgi:hypothetical protein
MCLARKREPGKFPSRGRLVVLDGGDAKDYDSHPPGPRGDYDTPPEDTEHSKRSTPESRPLTSKLGAPDVGSTVNACQAAASFRAKRLNVADRLDEAAGCSFFALSACNLVE